MLLAEALALALPEVEDGDPSARAADVEKAVFTQNNGVNQPYKAKLRSLSFNLKDQKNPDLRRRVLAEEISGAWLAAICNFVRRQLVTSDRQVGPVVQASCLRHAALPCRCRAGGARVRSAGQ